MSNGSADAGARIDALDLTLFDPIHSQSSDDDKRSWLAVQRAVRQPNGYSYLEIGSYLGGSLQQHLVDDACRSIVSIDNRPASLPDDRGPMLSYKDNSTARMLDNLERVAPALLGKITCFETDAAAVKAEALPGQPDFCFIDGEHTKSAVLSDFAFCLGVCAPDAAICFHDDAIIYPALAEIVSSLKRQGVPFTAWKFRGQTFGIFLRACPAAQDPWIVANSQAAHRWLLVRKMRAAMPPWLRGIVGGVVKKVLPDRI